jgi:nucleoside-diphosphate-sugar epimerase
MKILVTGANGLVGRALCPVLEEYGHYVIRAVRTTQAPGEVLVSDLNENTQWGLALSPAADVVVHLAGRVPSSAGESEGEANLYHQINTLGTANLAHQCAQHGVKRFIYISTVKVLGEGTEQPYREDDSEKPIDDYAISKWQAEKALWKIAAQTSMEIVVLRPPLVYGPGVKGNLLRLFQAIDRRRPLPLGAIENRRSLIFIGNLVDVIRLCVSHPKAAGKTYLVSDGDDVSTPELIRRIAAALGCRPFLVAIPVAWIQWVGRVLSKSDAVDRLLGSLYIDLTTVQRELGWKPLFSMKEGLQTTAQWYCKTSMATE